MSFLNELKRRNVLRVGAAYTVVAWLLIQVAETIFPLFGFDDTPARIVVIVMAIGFCPALILAWVFEFTPGGLKRETDIDESQPAARTSSKSLDRIIIVVLTLALAWFAFDKFVMESQPGASIETSIAVLPFSNRSALADDKFFVDGIHDDILTQLANLSGLEKVISRTSMDRYRDTTKSIQQIGKELEVATILEGGVQRSGNRIRINMQLIDAANDKHLWAETYDREMTAENLFAIQSEIAREVVSALDAVLSEQDHTRLDIQPTTSLEAYGEFVLGRQAMAERTVENFDEAISHFEKAIELDPDYAMPYVGLANSIQLRVFYIRPRQDVSEVSEQVQELIYKALSLNPLSGEAWAALGLLRKTQGNNEEAEKYYQKAIDLSPNYPSAYQWYSQLLSADESKRELALQYIRKATELDPLADILKVNLANQYRLLERRDEMYDVIKQGHARNPDFLLYYIEMTQALKQDGRFGEALRWSLEGVSRAPNHPYPRINACYLLINLAADQLAEQCLVKLLADFPGQPYKTYSLLSDLHTLRGDYQNALAIILEHYPEEPDKW
ncbi:MAG: tetratricopeptide repeat protein, partial [Anaerolineales bacterium]